MENRSATTEYRLVPLARRRRISTINFTVRTTVKILGHSALVLAAGAFELASWLFAAVLALFGLVSSIKAMTERTALGYFRRRRLERQRALAA
jgi:hypothetical protein